jgi:hypothetical protein
MVDFNARPSAPKAGSGFSSSHRINELFFRERDRCFQCSSPVALSHNEETEMRRQLAAIVFGVIVAVAVIYAVFDQRVSVRNLLVTAPSTQQSN